MKTTAKTLATTALLLASGICLAATNPKIHELDMGAYREFKISETAASEAAAEKQTGVRELTRLYSEAGSDNDEIAKDRYAQLLRNYPELIAKHDAYVSKLELKRVKAVEMAQKSPLGEATPEQYDSARNTIRAGINEYLGEMGASLSARERGTYAQLMAYANATRKIEAQLGAVGTMYTGGVPKTSAQLLQIVESIEDELMVANAERRWLVALMGLVETDLVRRAEREANKNAPWRSDPSEVARITDSALEASEQDGEPEALTDYSAGVPTFDIE